MNDTLARLGGDEFGALLEDCALEQAIRVAENLRSAVEDFVFSVDDNSYSLGVSIGLVSIDAASGTKSEIIKDADLAMVKAIDNVAKVMGISSIAEYVESNESFEALRDLGIEDAQGYWIGRPLPLVATISDGPRAAVR